MKKTIVGSFIIFAYVNLVPYVCRIWGGLDWVAQYLPDNGHFVSGLLFFVGFASVPAIPIVMVFVLRKWVPITFVVSIVVATALLAYWHHDYDLASDAQAAIGLIFIPIYTAMITAAIAGIMAVIELLIRRKRKVTNNEIHSTPETGASA